MHMFVVFKKITKDYEEFLEENYIFEYIFSKVDEARKYILSHTNEEKVEGSIFDTKREFYKNFCIVRHNVIENFTDIKKNHLKEEAEELRKKLREIEREMEK